MMDNHAKRNLRGLVASAIFAAMLGLGSGTASALVIDFDPAPFAGAQTTFVTDGFKFTFSGGGDFVASGLGGEPAVGETRSIQADSIPAVDPDIEIITIVLNAGGFFIFDSIHLNSVAGGITTVAGFDAGGEIYSSLVAAVFTGVELSNSLLPVNKVELRSVDFFSIRFDSFTVNTQMAVPEPGTLALFVTGLIGLGLLSRRRRQPMA